MKFRPYLRKFAVLLVILGAFIIAVPAVELFATGVGPQVTPGGGSKINNTPNELSILSIKTAEENKAAGANCGYSTVKGLLPSFLKGIQKVGSVDYEEVNHARFCGNDEDLASIQYSQSGILGLLTKVNNTIIEQRPASGVQFVEEKVYAITNPGVVYAQDPQSYFPGTGFDLLQPIRNFWGWSVNLVFGFLIIIILIIAFAIIFRQRLPGNVEVTIQNAIPNIVLAMILVPLSYAISGLFIDVITIGSNAVHDFLIGPGSPGHQVYEDSLAQTLPEGWENRGLYIDDGRVNWINARSQVDLRQELEAIAEGANVNSGGLSVIAGLLNILDEDAINDTSVTPGAASAWLGTIINAVLSVIMIVIGVKVFIKLFQKYLSLILMPIFSPFVFATVAVPGNGTKAIVNYAKTMGASSLGFIAAYAMFLLTIVFSSSAFQASVPDFSTGLWVPPLLNLQDINAFGANGAGLSGAGAGAGIIPFLFGLIALGIYFSIPKVLDQIDDALGAKFVLPEFIKTPIESFREANRMTFRTAPGVAARGLVSTARIGRGAAYAPFRAVQTIEDLRDRARGLTPGEEGTSKANRRRAAGKEIARLQREIAAEKAKGKNADGNKIRSLQAQEAAQRVKADAFGTGVGRPEGEAEPELKASFSFAGSPVVTISRAEAEGFRRQALAGNPVIIRGGKVTFEASGFILPNDIASKLEIYSTIAREGEFGEEIDALLVSGIRGGLAPNDFSVPILGPVPRGTLRGIARSEQQLDSQRIFWFKPGDFLEARVDDQLNVNPSRDGKKWEIGINLTVRHIDKFVGTSETDPNAKLRVDSDVLSDKVIFKIGEYESDPVRITIPRLRQ